MQDTIVITGKECADEIKTKIRHVTSQLKAQHNIVPKLSVILVGNNPASEIYIKQKQTQAEELGIDCHVHRLPIDTSPQKLHQLIDDLNKDPSVNAMILQLPLPLATKDQTLRAMMAIEPLKDADCFHPENIGLNFLDRANLVPCTAYGVVQLLDYNNIDVKGKHCVVVGTSNIAGKPLAVELINREATVTTCNVHTKNIREITKKADVLVLCVGRARYFDETYVNQNCIIIDVGINKVKNLEYDATLAEKVDLFGFDTIAKQVAKSYHLTPVQARNRVRKLTTKEFTCGDADYQNLLGKCQMITKVPGGVGLLTVANLLMNTVKLTLMQHNLKFEDFGLSPSHFH